LSQFPRNFIDDLRLHADIVSVVGDVVSLKKMGRAGRACARSTTRRRRRST